MHYVILCQARTGSTYLVRLLRSHPGVVSHGELFHPRAIYYADRKARMDAEAAGLLPGGRCPISAYLGRFS